MGTLIHEENISLAQMIVYEKMASRNTTRELIMNATDPIWLRCILSAELGLGYMGIFLREKVSSQ